MSVAFSEDGKYLAVGSSDGSIALLEVPTLKKIKTLTGHSAGVWTLIFGRGDGVLVSGSMDATVKIWQWKTEASATLVGHSDEVRSVAISPNGELLASGSRDNTAIIWDADTGRELERLKGHSHNVESVAFWIDKTDQSEPHLKLITASSDSTLKCWNVDCQRNRGIVFDVTSIPPLKLSPDGNRLAVMRRAARQDKAQMVTLRDVATGVTRDISLPMEGKVAALAMSNEHLAVGVNDKVRVIPLRVGNGEEIEFETEHRIECQRPCFLE